MPFWTASSPVRGCIVTPSWRHFSAFRRRPSARPGENARFRKDGWSKSRNSVGKGDESTPGASHAPVASSTSQASTPAGAAVPDLDLLCIPLVAASLSAGVGSLQTEADVLDYFAFRSDWLCRKGNPDKMVLMKVYGDSMEPEICHGDMALIDQSKQQIYPHTIYAVGVNEEIYIKQIETLPGHRMLLRSLNERYEPIEVDLRGDMAESVRIIGKVIWWCREA